MKSSNIGGQAVMEGIMMRHKDVYSIAVRKPDKEIEVKVEDYKSVMKNKKILSLPIIRGVFSFIDSLVIGTKCLMYSASFFEEEEEEKAKKEALSGDELTKYEAKQIQRSIERQIRQDKKNIAGLQGVLTSTTNNNKLIEETRTELAKKTLQYNTHKRDLDGLIEQISSKKDNTRLFIVEKYDNKTISNITKLANKYNNSDIIGLKVNDVEIKEIGEHIISRTYGKKVRFEDVEDTLKNPVKYGKIRTDNSQQIKGENCTVVINVKTGKLITVYPKKTKKE